MRKLIAAGLTVLALAGCSNVRVREQAEVECQQLGTEYRPASFYIASAVKGLGVDTADLRCRVGTETLRWSSKGRWE